MFSGLAAGINSTVFNNFLNDVYHLTAATRGVVEFPRELPGMLIVFVLAILTFLGDIRMAAIGMLAAALGAVGLGLLSPTFALMLLWMMVFSLGTHIFMPLSASIGMTLSRQKEYGTRLGRFSAYSLSATIVGYAIVWVGFSYFGMTYTAAFLLTALAYVGAALTLSVMEPRKPVRRKIRIVLHKRYSLYYLLCIVNGARKQIFLTFAPWVLIQIFQVTPPVFAILGVLIAAVSIGTRKLVGRAIDDLGERVVLSAEALLLIALCAGYAFSGRLLPAGIAVVVIAGCYVLDNSTNAVDMARSTYVRKIAPSPEDVTPTLSAGLSIDHVVSMTVPVLGGLLWVSAGYQAVFIAAAGIGLLNFILSTRMKGTAPVVAAPAED